MPWLPEVQALEVGMIRPVIPRKTPRFTGAVWPIILIYVVALMPLVLFSSTILPKSQIALGVPADEP